MADVKSAPGTNEMCTIACDSVSELPLTFVSSLDLMAIILIVLAVFHVYVYYWISFTMFNVNYLFKHLRTLT